MTASDPDSKAISKVLDHVKSHGHQPDTLYADTAYGSDANYEKCHPGRSYQPLEAYRP